MTGVQTEVSVTVRYFAAARAAAGAEDEVLTLPAATSVAALVSELGKRNAELAVPRPATLLVSVRRHSGTRPGDSARFGTDFGRVTPIRRGLIVICVTLRNSNELATLRYIADLNWGNASPAWGFRILLGFASSRNAASAKR
jgi:molybdopterin converting factor small subunit